MNLSALYSALKEIRIPDKEIFLHGLYGSTDDNEKLSLTIKVVGDSQIWEIYYKERGNKHSVREFKSESKAYEYYLSKMKDFSAS